MKVLIVGAAGMLGSVTVTEWAAAGHEVLALTRADVDVTSHHDVVATVGRHQPDLLINCTAFNQVDEAEDRPVDALAVNAFAVRSLARAARQVGAAFVHYSTDFVFDGAGDQPNTEDDPPNPQSAYAASKLLGELFAAEVPNHLVLRVESLFGGSSSRSTIDRMRQQFAEGRPVSAFVDRTVSPSYVLDVARATRELIDRRAPAGVYHCVNSGFATWLDVAEQVRALSGFTAGEIRPVRASDVQMRARRPQFAALSNARLLAQGIAMPHWTESLARHLGSGAVA